MSKKTKSKALTWDDLKALPVWSVVSETTAGVPCRSYDQNYLIIIGQPRAGVSVVEFDNPSISYTVTKNQYIDAQRDYGDVYIDTGKMCRMAKIGCENIIVFDGCLIQEWGRLNKKDTLALFYELGQALGYEVEG